MAYERTWQFDNNRAFVPGTVLELSKYQLWYIKAFLTGQIGGATQGLWTVVGSCGATDGLAGTLVGAMDGVDRWGATFDALKLVRAGSTGASSPCAWIVLQSPAMVNGQQYYMCLSFSALTGTPTDYQCNVRWAKNAFTVAATATWAPVAPADMWAPNSTTPSTVWQLNNNSATTNRVNAILSVNGDFMMYWTRASYGQSETVLAAMMPTSRRAQDQYPLFTSAAFSGTANASVFNNYYTSAGATFYTANGARMFDNSGTATNRLIPFQAQGDSSPDYVDSTVLDFPAWVLGQYSTTRHWMRGRLSDFGAIMGGSGNGTSYSAPSGSVIRDGSNNIVYATQGALLFPATAIPDMS